MTKINLKHLRYFWAVASEGSITGATNILHLTPQTISGQLRVLEQSIGSKLFQKSGRNLVLTDTGQTVFAYADEIFNLETELQEVIAGGPNRADMTFKVGVAMVVPKLVAYRILKPVMDIQANVKLVCHEAPLVDLLGDLSVNRLDLVLADSPISPTLSIKAYNHLLGESGISFFARREDAMIYRRDFPASLDSAPMLMPTNNSTLRRSLDQWLDQKAIKPLVIAEFEDRALMKTFGEAGTGIFTSPSAIEEEVRAKYGVEVIGRTEELQERYYAISTERRIKHPAVAAIAEVAKQTLFT